MIPRATTQPVAMPSTLSFWRSPATVVVALILYGAILIATAPASVLAQALAAATSGMIALEGPQRSVWRGSAQGLIVNIPLGGTQRYERLEWEWLAAPLLKGQLAARLRLDGPKLRGSGSLALCRDGIRLSDAEWRIPASSFATHISALHHSALYGEVILRTRGFTVGKEHYAGAATIDWNNAGSALTRLRPLGNYRALVTGSGPHAEFEFETSRGSLQAAGRGSWSRDQGLRLQGTARAESGSESKLAGVLSLLGPDRGDGTHELRLSRVR